MTFCSKISFNFGKNWLMKLKPENGTFNMLQWKMVGPTFQTPSGTNYINKKFMIRQKVTNMKIRSSSNI